MSEHMLPAPIVFAAGWAEFKLRYTGIPPLPVLMEWNFLRRRRQ